jgi:hypothetical protein
MEEDTHHGPERWPTPTRQEKEFPYQCPLKKHLKSPRCSKCDSATRIFYGLKDGKITVNFSGWDKTGLFSRRQAFEVKMGSSGRRGTNGGHGPESGARKGAVT